VAQNSIGADSIRAWLRAHGYKSAPVSIDTSDWYFNQIWLRFQSPAEATKREALQREYIDHLLARADYYQALARRTLNRTPMHVMLLHVNAINAASIGQIAKAFESRGWKFSSPDRAFADPLYAAEPMILPAGESILWALAKAAGETGLRYPAEDSIYEEPKLREKNLLPAGGGR
jgi:peptidoglycan-N-acetylglucosamine deacetylase